MNPISNINNADVQKLCEIIASNYPLVELKVEPIQGAQILDCFNIVSRQVENHGGEIVLGWQLWKSKLLIEAEAHAVWKSPDGTLRDISPKPNGMIIDSIVFLQDDSLIYEGKQIDNIRLNITGNELVDCFIETYKALYRVKNRGRLANLDGEEFAKALTEHEYNIIVALSGIANWIEKTALQSGTMNSICFCNSKLPFSECHGNDFINKMRMA